MSALFSQSLPTDNIPAQEPLLSVFCICPACPLCTVGVTQIGPSKGVCITRMTLLFDLLGLTGGVCAVTSERGGVGGWDDARVFI